MTGTEASPPSRTPASGPRRLVALLVVSLLGACAAPGDAPDAEPAPVERARTESVVKLALIEASDVDAAAIGVVASDGTVTLDGFVASAAEREAALRAARAAAPALDVVDELRIRD